MGVTTRFVPPGPARADAVVVGLYSTDDGPAVAPGAEWLVKQLAGKLDKALKSLGATGRAEEIVKIPTLGLLECGLVVAVGLGGKPERGAPEQETVRRAVGAALRALASTKRVHVAIGRELRTGVGAAEGALLGAYSYTEYKSSPTPQVNTQVTISVNGDKTSPAKVALRRAKVLSDSVALARDLVNAPPNDLYPASLATRLSDAATAAGAEVEVLDERALKRGNYGGILGVGGGSSRPPRLLRATYVGPKARGGQRVRVALVGKGITFDSGGLNLKPGAGLAWMKCDMGGAAAAVAAVIAAAQLKLPVEVTATVAIAENMISGSSYRPSDVLTLRSGKTLEITNTDAEGRVVLADAITRACEDEPDYLIEASTLTGAQIVALGSRVIGAMGSEDLRDRVVAAGNAAGESLWGMPLPEELRAGLESPVADLANLPSQPVGGMLFAGIFLGEFVADGVPWVHLDIAGPAFNQGAAWGYTPKGGTGAAVRTMLSTLETLAVEG